MGCGRVYIWCQVNYLLSSNNHTKDYMKNKNIDAPLLETFLAHRTPATTAMYHSVIKAFTSYNSHNICSRNNSKQDSSKSRQITTNQSNISITNQQLISIFKKQKVDTLLSYTTYMKKNKKSYDCIRQHLTKLKAFNQYLIDNELVTNDPFRIVLKRIPKQKVPLRPTKLLDFEKAQSIIENTDDLKWKAIFSLMIYTGMRRSEVVKLNRADVSSSYSHLTLRETKTGGNRIQPLPEKASKALKEYMTANDHHNLPQLFSSANIKRMSVDTLYRRYTTTFNAAPHSARATVVTKLLLNEVDPKVIADYVGHSNTYMQQKYDKRDNQSSKALRFMV